MKNSVKNTTIADRVLLIALVALSIAGIFQSREAASQGNDVVIEISGNQAYVFPLATDRAVTVTGPLGDAVLEIKDRKVRIREACCSNRLCVREGWVKSGVIVCLPNRIVVFVGGPGSQRRDVDAVTG